MAKMEASDKELGTLQPHRGDAPGGGRLREQVLTVAEDVRELGSIAKEGAREKLHDVQRRTADAYESGKQGLRNQEERLLAYVREKPLKSVLIAVGAGMLLGVLCRR
jgi:ElaB/YqjD/DUF883 family membrane-anchored ribosome-binding protein